MIKQEAMERCECCARPELVMKLVADFETVITWLDREQHRGSVFGAATTGGAADSTGRCSAPAGSLCILTSFFYASLYKYVLPPYLK